MTAGKPPWGGQQQTGQGMPAGQEGGNGQAGPFGAMYAALDLGQVNGLSAADALVWYNRAGIAAHPAHPREKMLARPSGYHFDELGVLTGDQLAAAYQVMQRNPQLRVAIINSKASGLMTIDADDMAEWARFLTEYTLPGTAVAETGRDGGGLHLLYRRGDAVEALLKQGPWSAAYPHIEVKSKGMIIAAPSVHSSGRRYQWRPGSWPAEIGEAIEQRLPPRIDCGTGSGPETIRAVTQALNDGKIPATYLVAGRVVMIGEPGNRESSPHPLPQAAVPVEAPALMNLLAHHTFTFRWKQAKTGRFEVEHSPAAGYLHAVLASRSWPGLRPLNGVIGAPVLRPDGSLLQEDGYDQATGLYLASLVQARQIPARPQQELVKWARELLLDWLLRDFPWRGPADKANYVAMLVTQVLRRHLGGAPVPLFPITATDQGSGKTLLATICGVLYGQASLTWTGDDEELRKTLTSVMSGQEGVINFDNLLPGTTIRSAVLAKLLTDRTWGDRMLGKNVLGQFANDRLWTATGNNLRIGGDMASRVVLVSLDADMPHPERRGGFAIPDLESWVREDANQQQVLAAVLVLVADWAAAGCPVADVVPFRQFTRWAQACGGFLAHHEVEGFLANIAEVEAADDDDIDWAGFLARWQLVLGAEPVTSEQVTSSCWDPRWEGTFPSGKGDEPLGSAKSMGRRLKAQKGRYHGTWVLHSTWDAHGKVWHWRAEKWRGDVHKTWEGEPLPPGWSRTGITESWSGSGLRGPDGHIYYQQPDGTWVRPDR